MISVMRVLSWFSGMYLMWIMRIWMWKSRDRMKKSIVDKMSGRKGKVSRSMLIRMECGDD